MVKNIAEANRQLKQWFPRLNSDPRFKPTSEWNKDYNCIAWAMRLSDRWVDIDENAAGHWWPLPIVLPYSSSRQALIEAFEAVKFQRCNDDKMERGYDKVALYARPHSDIWTHAARVIAPHTYHSKIGRAWDIHHSDGNVMHTANPQNTYGLVYQFMKRPKYLRYYSFILSARLIANKIANEIRCLM